MRRIALISCLLFVGSLFATRPELTTLELPREIVISDEMGVVERIPTGAFAIEHEMSQWFIKELMNRNKELEDKVKAAKTKWYIVAAGCATTFIPLVIVGIELWNITNDCD